MSILRSGGSKATVVWAALVVACRGERLGASGDTLMRPESAPAASVASIPPPIELPRFSDYRVPLRFRGRPAPVDLRSDPQARFFRTKLREGARAGPNFADHLTVVTWGCGSGCQVNAIVDARTGRVHPQWLETNAGVAVRRASALLIADPVDSIDPPPPQCASCGTPAAYVWRGGRLEAVGGGDHRHLLQQRVRLERYGH